MCVLRLVNVVAYFTAYGRQDAAQRRLMSTENPKYPTYCYAADHDSHAIRNLSFYSSSSLRGPSYYVYIY